MAITVITSATPITDGFPIAARSAFTPMLTKNTGTNRFDTAPRSVAIRS